MSNLQLVRGVLVPCVVSSAPEGRASSSRDGLPDKVLDGLVSLSDEVDSVLLGGKVGILPTGSGAVEDELGSLFPSDTNTYRGWELLRTCSATVYANSRISA